MTTTGGPHTTSATQVPAVSSPHAYRGRLFRRVTSAAAVGSTLFGSLWVLRSSGTLLPVAGPLSSVTIAYLGGIAWVVAAIGLAVAPTWWHMKSAPFRKFWWITYPWAFALTTGAFTIGTAPIATGHERLLGAAAAIPVLLLVVTLVGRDRSGPTGQTPKSTLRPRLSAAGLLLAGLGVGVALVVTIACSFAFSLATPNGGRFVGGEPLLIVEQMSNLGGLYEITWEQDGYLFKRAPPRAQWIQLLMRWASPEETRSTRHAGHPT